MDTNELPTLEELVEAVDLQTEGASDLDRITVAESLSYDLGRLADQLTDHYVQAAREAGHSWAEIGKQLGMSKQGAQQRYVVPATDSDAELVAKMLTLELPPQGDPDRPESVRRTLKKVKEALHFQRFNNGARMVVVNAQTEARALRSPYIGPEHLLLSLLGIREDRAVKALGELGIDPVEASTRVREAIGTGTASGTGHIPFTKEAKKVLELSLRESVRLRHGYIGGEHLLLGLIRGDNKAVELLAGLGARREQIQGKVEELFDKE